MNANECRRPFRFFDGACLCAVLSTFAYYLALLPSLNAPWLIWAVPALWTVLIRQKVALTALSNSGTSLSSCVSPATPSRGYEVLAPALFYLKIWLAGVAGWLLPMLWLRFDTSWANVLWIILSVSLGLSWALFVGLSRTGVHHMRIPVIVVAPVVWCGLEWLRKNFLFGGFSVGSLEHALYGNTTLIQIADISGEYGVGMFIVFVGACVGRSLPISDDAPRLQRRLIELLNSKRFACVSCVLVLMMVLAYGNWRLDSLLGQSGNHHMSSRATIALHQGNIESPADISEETIEGRLLLFEELSQGMTSQVDLVVWPEATLPWTLRAFQPGLTPEGWEDQPRDSVEEMLRDTLDENHKPLIRLAKRAQTALLLGIITSVHEQGPHEVVIRTKNSAALVDPQNGIGPRYDKINLAPFGECNPLVQWLPERYAVRSRLSAGTRIPVFPIRSVRNTPGKLPEKSTGAERLPPLLATVNICFDSTFPHFIRRQVRTLTEQGKEPDVLINLSNDAFFDHTFIVEMHLATHVFRAIETRKPYLAATNAGYSAWIDNTGRIIEKGERRATMYVVASIGREPTKSLYLYWGDSLPICCACFNGLVIAWWSHRKFVPERPLTNHTNGNCGRIV